MNIKDNDVLFLLGAGCSYDAGIPTVVAMINQIEETLLKEHPEWADLESLYHYVKSSIIYSEGIFGNYNSLVGVERLMVTLSELEKKERNIVYPFIANWNNRLIDLAGANFDGIKKLKSLITNQLTSWISIPDYNKASYYRFFYRFQQALQYPIRVFSLNYDLCFESMRPQDIALETGFDESKNWNSMRFEPNTLGVEPAVYLYKLHGSINWYRAKERGNVLRESAHPRPDAELVFGTEAKLQSADPYLFFVYQLRQYLLDSKIVVVLGYSFSDTYINTLLVQALQSSPDRALLIIDPSVDESYLDKLQMALGINSPRQLISLAKRAAEFLDADLTVENIERYMLKSADDVF